MRSNALIRRRPEGFGAIQKDDYTQDNFQIPEELWEAKRVRLARAAEEAANLPGNAEAPDFEEFALKYHITVTAFA